MTIPARRLHVIGAGLIGASVALVAGRNGWEVTVEDADPSSERAVRDWLVDDTGRVRRPDGEGGDGARRVDLVVVAVPPHQIVDSVRRALDLYVDATVMDVASIKAQPLAHLQRLDVGLDRFVPTHPLAGSEATGWRAARADLFTGRSWVVCDHAGLAQERMDVVCATISAWGATPIRLDAERHDAVVARTSHLPQVVSSALARIVDRAVAVDDPSVDLGSVAGPALLDMTRIAASSPELWSSVAAANSSQLRCAVADLRDLLDEVQRRLGDPADGGRAVGELVLEGQKGRRRLVDKHAASGGRRVGADRGRPRLGAGDPDAVWEWVDVVVADEPGGLARIFEVAATLDINIEDLHIDHAPYAPFGTVTLAVRAGQAGSLRDALAPQGTD